MTYNYVQMHILKWKPIKQSISNKLSNYIIQINNIAKY